MYGYVKGNVVEIQTPTHWNVIYGRTTALLACVIAQQYSWATSVCSFIRASKKSARVSKFHFCFFLLLEELRVWNCVIHGLPVLYHSVQFIAELVSHPFIAGLKTNTEKMEYLVFQASSPLIWPRFHLIFITSIIAVEVLSCLVSGICRRWTVVTWWWAFRRLNLVRFPLCKVCFSDVMDRVLQFSTLTVLIPSRIKLVALTVVTVTLFVAMWYSAWVSLSWIRFWVHRCNWRIALLLFLAVSCQVSAGHFAGFVKYSFKVLFLEGSAACSHPSRIWCLPWFL